MLNVSICIKRLSTLGLLFSFMQAFSAHQEPIAPQADNIEAAYNQLTAAMPNRLEHKIAEKTEKCINNFNCTLGELACLVQEEAISIESKEKKSSLLQEITKTRQVVNQLYKEFVNSPTQAQLDITLYVINSILKQLEDALNSDFTAYKGFNFEDIAKRSKLAPELDIVALEKELNQTEEYFKKIQKLSENIGLSLVNHVYRNTFDRFVVQPCSKYNLHLKALVSTAAFGAGAYLWYRLNDSIAGCSAYDAGKQKDSDPKEWQSWSESDAWWKRLPLKAHDTINGKIRYFMGWPSSVEGSYKERQVRNMSTQAHDYISSGLSNIEETNRILATNPQETRIVSAAQLLYQNGLSNINQAKFLLNPKTKRPRKFFAHLEEEAFRMGTGAWAIYMMSIYGPYKDQFHSAYNKALNSIDKGLKYVHYRLKGGAFYQQYKLKQHEFKINPRFTFDDIIGNEHAKEKLSIITKYMEDSELYERAGLAPAAGYMLSGPTRTGKSMIAEALAGELQRIKGGNPDDFPFFSIDARYIASVGNFEFMMNLVKNHAPCIIFIDEIDLLNLHRKFREKNTLLSEFLSVLSGCSLNNDPDKKIIVIIATNKPEDLDPSLLSRFPEKIPFEYPAFLHRAEAILRELQSKGLPHDQFDLKKLAEQTEGCSYEDIHKIINNAQFLTRQSGRPVTQLDIEQSINTEIRGIIYHDYKHLSQEELNLLSVHMAGHAMAYMLIEGKAEQLSQVTIRPVKAKITDGFSLNDPAIKYGHIFTHMTGDSLKFVSKKDIKRKCMIELAGHIAEELIFQTTFNTAHSCSAHDKAQAFYWAKKYFLNGLDEQLLNSSKAMLNKITGQAHAFMESCEQELRTLFEQQKDLIKFLADILKKAEVLDAAQLQEVMNLHKMLDGKSLDDFLAELQTQMQAEEGTQQPAVAAPTA